MLHGWQSDQTLLAEYYVVDPFVHDQGSWQAINLYDSVGELPDGFSPDIIVLAVKPQLIDQALGEAASLGGEGTSWLSIAAGVSTAKLKKHLGDSAKLLRAMPNTPASIGRGITALYATDNVSDGMRNLATQLLAACGEVVQLDDERLMDAVTALSGSGPAYVFLLTEVMAEAGRKLGLPTDMAMLLARQTVCGASALMDKDPLPASEHRQNVTSKGGTTAAALSVLNSPDGLQMVFDAALLAAAKRAAELDEAL